MTLSCIHASMANAVYNHLFLINSDPVGTGEPLVILNVSDSIFQISESLGEIHLKKIFQQIFKITGEMGGKSDL